MGGRILTAQEREVVDAAYAYCSTCQCVHMKRTSCEEMRRARETRFYNEKVAKVKADTEAFQRHNAAELDAAIALKRLETECERQKVRDEIVREAAKTSCFCGLVFQFQTGFDEHMENVRPLGHGRVE